MKHSHSHSSKRVLLAPASCSQETWHVWEQLASTALHEEPWSVLFSTDCNIGVPSFNLLTPFSINIVPENISLVWNFCLLGLSQGFWRFISSLETVSSNLFPRNEHFHSTHEIYLLYLRHLMAPGTALFRSLHCLLNLVARNSCNAWNTVFTSFTDTIKSMKSRLRYLVPKSFSRHINHNWLKF